MTSAQTTTPPAGLESTALRTSEIDAPRSRFIFILIAIAAIKSGAGLISYSLGLSPARTFPPGIFVAVILTFSAVGAFLLSGKRRDRRAVYLGAAYLCGGCNFANSLFPNAALAAALLHPDAFVPLFLWLFARDFPRTLWLGRERTLLSVAIGASFAGGLLLFGLNFVIAVFVVAGPFVNVPPFLQPFATQAGAGLYWTILYSLAIPALPFMIYKSRSAVARERRRVFLFSCGIVAGIAPVMLIILLEGLIPSFLRFMNQPNVRYWSGFIVYPSLLSVPVTTAYAVLRHRVLDVRFIIRKALQYAFARYTVLAATGIPLAIFAYYLYNHRTETLQELVTGRSSVLLIVLIAAGWGMHRARKRIFGALDRRFFREQYDASLVLARVATSIQDITRKEDLTLVLLTELDKAFHPESIYLMLYEESVAQFRCTQNAMRPLESTAELAGILMRDGSPLVIDYDSQTVSHFLPEPEREWLAEGAIRLVVPLIGSNKSLLGLVGLGERRSELPYSHDDQVVLSAIAASAVATIEKQMRRAGKSLSSAQELVPEIVDAPVTARVCITCGQIDPPDAESCSTCKATVSDASIPYILLGKFRFERQIGKGGMGIVYKAVDLTLGRPVAIKTLPRTSPSHAMQLRQEARAIASLNHPHLATIFGVETWHGQPLLIFEYLPSGNLYDRIRADRMSYSEVLQLGVILADVLGLLHSSGMIHRDVKPSNIAYLDSKTPKLLDFGLAQMMRERDSFWFSPKMNDLQSNITWVESSPSGFFVGTPQYMAPELIRYRQIGPSIDLWALCLVLYEAIAGVNPMYQPTLRDTLLQIAKGRVPDVREYRSDCPAPIAEFLQSALLPDPSRRPSRAQSIRDQLKELLESSGEGIPEKARRETVGR
jgi:Protein kinase domain